MLAGPFSFLSGLVRYEHREVVVSMLPPALVFDHSRTAVETTHEIPRMTVTVICRDNAGRCKIGER
jgi:hypothetical protein